MRVGAARVSATHALPGPLAPEEDGVAHFVSMVARAYLGLEAPTPSSVEHARRS